VEELAAAKTFFQQQFPDVVEGRDGSDAAIQRHLWQLSQNQLDPIADLANVCLRCYVSNQTERVCLKLEAQFGTDHGFTRYDLFPFVLDDVLLGEQARSPREASETTLYRSLATEILQTFDPEKASLGTWVTRLVRQHKELNAFLLERGVYLVSDWAILNDTAPKQLQRILSEFHGLTPVEIQRSTQLLHGYHQVYRQERLKQRQAGMRGQCTPPTLDQLAQIAQLIQPAGMAMTAPESIRGQLQILATQLRQYRIYVRGGAALVQSLDQPETQAVAMSLQAPDSDTTQDDHQEFLGFYREQFLQCLDQSLERVTSDRLKQLQRKTPAAASQFLTAMRLFHCGGQAMGEIAAQVGLQAQYQVTRLLKLKEFRADVRQQVLVRLRDRVLAKARDYANPDRLHQLDQQIETALDEQIATVMQQAEAEASIAKNRPLNSLFARRLCHHLDTRM
jgi:hypothetical protein